MGYRYKLDEVSITTRESTRRNDRAMRMRRFEFVIYAVTPGQYLMTREMTITLELIEDYYNGPLGVLGLFGIFAITLNEELQIFSEET